MTEPVADLVLDEVMVLGIELAAVAKPRDPTKFVELLQRFTHAIIREAFEHQDEIRLRLGIQRPRVNDQGDCPYCGEMVGSMVGHECDRMRELGLVACPECGTRSTAHATWCGQNSSTGATEAKSNAEQLTPATAASETSAAPSTSDSCRREAPPTPAPLLDGLSPQGQPATRAPERSVLSEKSGNKRGGQRAMTDDDCRRLCAEYDQACKTNGGKAPYGWIAKKVVELGLAVSTVRRALGLDARGGDGKPTQTEPPRSGSGHRLTREQVATLSADYDRALRDNGGELPDGWLSQQGRALGCTQQSISYHVAVWRRAAAEPKSNGHAERDHTKSHACWCRKTPSSTKSPWCSIAKPAGTIPGLAGLQDARPRAERYMPRRTVEVEVE